ncbi:hypothetical protein FHR70_003733 [Microvirga lupini]|uniref:Uncharacterized protein n=1 Tax=Microvirga lupini TaxID=420324 RepID=A0A7W4YXJ8_9HYPH|nr:hypothetical protein [Microvirga lupini]MBB3020647.1 hypothetical protein [Microvirga lupini]
MNPRSEIAKLDRKIAKTGQTVTLRRGTAAAPVATATVKAHVRGFKPDELIGGIDQNDSKAILSPSGLAGWPGGTPIKGDWITIDGRVRSIVAAEPVKMNDVLVRFELQVKG